METIGENKRKLILWTSLLGSFWSAYIVTSVNVAIPSIAREFEASATYTSWIITSSLLITSMIVLPVGRLSDVYGRKKTLFYGMAIMALTTLLCGFATSVTMLITLRGVQGIGSAMVATTLLSIISGAYPANSRGKVLGINVAFTYMGLSAGPFLGGWIINQFGWRGIFHFSAPAGLFILWMIHNISQEWKSDEKAPLDYKGAWIYALGILGIIWGLTNFNGYSAAPWAFMAGFLLLVLFARYEMRIKEPLINIQVLKSNRVLIFSTLASFINYSSTYAISFMMSMFLQFVKGFDPGITGTILLMQPAVQAVFSPIAGFLSDRIDPKFVASTGMGVIALSLFFLSGFQEDTPVWLMLLLLAFIGLGFALFSSPNTNSIMSSMDKKEYGIASGILSTSRTVGQSFSMALTALIVSIYIGKETVSAANKLAFTHSFRLVFLIFSAFCLFGVWASMARGRRNGL